MKKTKLTVMALATALALTACGDAKISKKSGDTGKESITVNGESKDSYDSDVSDEISDGTMELQADTAKKLCEDMLAVSKDYRAVLEDSESGNYNTMLSGFDTYYNKCREILSSVSMERYWMNIVYENILEGNNYNGDGLSIDMYIDKKYDDEYEDGEDIDVVLDEIRNLSKEEIFDEAMKEAPYWNELKNADWDIEKTAFMLLFVNPNMFVSGLEGVVIKSVDNISELDLDSYKKILGEKSIEANDVEKIALADVTYAVDDIIDTKPVVFTNTNGKWRILSDTFVNVMGSVNNKRKKDAANLDYIESIVQMCIHDKGNCVPGEIYLYYDENNNVAAKGDTGIENDVIGKMKKTIVRSAAYKNKNALKITIADISGKDEVTAEYIEDSEIK